MTIDTDNDTTASQSSTPKKPSRPLGISFKVSEKGAMSVYGLGRFPVTLYKEQWKKLLAKTEELQAFLGEHDAELKTKGE